MIVGVVGEDTLRWSRRSCARAGGRRCHCTHQSRRGRARRKWLAWEYVSILLIYVGASKKHTRKQHRFGYPDDCEPTLPSC